MLRCASLEGFLLNGNVEGFFRQEPYSVTGLRECVGSNLLDGVVVLGSLINNRANTGAICSRSSDCRFYSKIK
jgi:hypothetical protein